jgi:hypothetical protein
MKNPFGPMIPKRFLETGNGITGTGNGIIFSPSSHRIKKLLSQQIHIWSNDFEIENVTLKRFSPSQPSAQICACSLFNPCSSYSVKKNYFKTQSIKQVSMV